MSASNTCTVTLRFIASLLLFRRLGRGCWRRGLLERQFFQVLGRNVERSDNKRAVRRTTHLLGVVLCLFYFNVCHADNSLIEPQARKELPQAVIRAGDFDLYWLRCIEVRIGSLEVSEPLQLEFLLAKEVLD